MTSYLVVNTQRVKTMVFRKSSVVLLFSLFSLLTWADDIKKDCEQLPGCTINPALVICDSRHGLQWQDGGCSIVCPQNRMPTCSYAYCNYEALGPGMYQTVPSSCECK
jgi:hypothetical protein